MTAITVKRTIVRRTRAQRSATRQVVSRDYPGSYLAGERTVEFTIEALLLRHHRGNLSMAGVWLLRTRSANSSSARQA